MKRRIYLLLGVCLAIAGAPAFADGRDRDRHERHHRADEVYRLRQQGALKPLADIREQVLEQFPGRILETEFENKDGLTVYEFYILQDDGIVREVKVDARSGRILTVETD